MAGVNITEVHLLSVPLENDYLHTLYFASKDAQSSYFLGKEKHKGTEYSYQRKDGKIRFHKQYDALLDCNYVMYKNSYYSNKWFYAFITNMEYKDDGMTEISIETDVIQSWMFDYTVKSSFVEREHVSNDTVGLHTVPETLETGEYICNELVRTTDLQDYSIVMMVTEWASSDNRPLACNYGGVWASGGAYICSSMQEMLNLLQLYDNDGKGDAVTCVYICPTKIINNTSTDLKFSGNSSPTKLDFSFPSQTTIDGYTPKNKKLLCYPYNYILMSNNAGSSNVLRYENFDSTTCTFEIAGVPTVGGSIKCAPKNYKGIDRIQEEGIMLGKFPALSWSSDLYTNWLTQNAVNIGVGIGSSALQIVGGIASMATGAGAMAGVGMVASGLMGVTSSVGQIYQHSLTPASAKGNVNGGDINTAYKMNLFYFYKMSIKEEYARIIDEYFTMYGYKVNRVKVPEKNHRANFWYTKTIDVNIDGPIPMEDMKKIKDCYNRGITFWKNASNIGNYSVSNTIS